jgi:biotin carboxyl carrier protein
MRPPRWAYAPSPAQTQAPAGPPLTGGRTLFSGPRRPAEPAPRRRGRAINPPLVGTVVLAPEPGAKPFSAPGQKVGVGRIQAHRRGDEVMNPMRANQGRTVRQRLVTDGQPIEYDQPLVVIDLDASSFGGIANRGRLRLRIHAPGHELAHTAAVHSTADADAMHVRLADEAVCIGSPAARDSYLNIPNIISAAEIVHADAIHPGYGFLSENAQFAEIVELHNIIWVGPKP